MKVGGDLIFDGGLGELGESGLTLGLSLLRLGLGFRSGVVIVV